MMENNKKYYGICKNDMYAFEYYKITLTEEKFEKTESGKSWRKKPIETKQEVIKFEEYFNYISSVDFFRGLGGTERVTQGYTFAGYIPVQLTSISPEKNIKIIRKFKIEKIEG